MFQKYVATHNPDFISSVPVTAATIDATDVILVAPVMLKANYHFDGVFTFSGGTRSAFCCRVDNSVINMNNQLFTTEFSYLSDNGTPCVPVFFRGEIFDASVVPTSLSDFDYLNRYPISCSTQTDFSFTGNYAITFDSYARSAGGAVYYGVFVQYNTPPTGMSSILFDVSLNQVTREVSVLQPLK